MKKIIALMILTVASVVGISAQKAGQPMANQEAYLGAGYVGQNVNVSLSQFDISNMVHSFGVVSSYTAYVGGDKNSIGKVGLTGELGVNFKGGSVSLATGMGGVTFKNRNAKQYQPYVKALAGVSAQEIRVAGVWQKSGIKFAWEAGGGLDINTSDYSRTKFRIGADYINTNFFNQRQNNVRVHAGIVF